MEQKRITLNVSGVNITLITNENEEYIKALGKETEKLIYDIGGSSLERSSITAALSFLDERNKLSEKLSEYEEELNKLREENALLKNKVKEPKPIKEIKNPIRELTNVEKEGLTVFYERSQNKDE